MTLFNSCCFSLDQTHLEASITKETQMKKEFLGKVYLSWIHFCFKILQFYTSILQAIRTIIEEALTQFSADRTGLPDFALESAGKSFRSSQLIV